MAELCIIFCFRDRELSRVKHALDSLSLQDNKNFRVLFVDYGSSDATGEKVKALCSKYSFCTYLFIDSQGKFWNRAEALNYGILSCDTPWVFTADVDLVFKKDFISELYKQVSKHEARFFAVGYLNEAQTRSLDVNALGILSFTKSQDFALGMVLASREMLAKVNGYNSFYAIWGMEDNDLKARMDASGIKTSFVQEVYMLHQYHPPASTAAGGMPEGWIAFTKDYFSSGGEVIGLDSLVLPPQRTAKLYKTDPAFVSKIIRGRKLFLRHELINTIIRSKEKKLVITIDVSAYELPADSGTIRMMHSLNKWFQRLKLSVHAESNYKDQYISLREAREEVYFVLKSLHTLLVDHLIEESAYALKLVIVRP